MHEYLDPGWSKPKVQQHSNHDPALMQSPPQPKAESKPPLPPATQSLVQEAQQLQSDFEETPLDDDNNDDHLAMHRRKVRTTKCGSVST
jgi:hypothetical protein